MRYFFPCLAILSLFSSCNNDKRPIVDTVYVDSILNHYTPPLAQKANQDDLEFWKNRIDRNNPGISNESKYAAALVARFHLLGDINDLVLSDSILRKVDELFAHKEGSPILALSKHAILQHRFKEADSLLSVAKKVGIREYESLTASFDVDFEQGRILLASTGLKRFASSNDYGYNFRYAKLAHYNGDIDSSIAAMQRAATVSGNDIYLKQAALSNEADLYLHDGQLKKAYALYRESVSLNAADLHSIMGIGWIALLHDKNDSLAEKIFRFAHSKTKAPDPVFRLVQMAMARGDSTAAVHYAREFEQQVTQPVYGNMYNKYMIELYTDILNEPAKAEVIAKRELDNRTTPQTYAWYAWSLFSNHKASEAYKVYQQQVSGKPLESLELYWMGKMMQGLDKGYNAQQFYKAAYKNRYDLSPDKIKSLEKEK